MSLKKRQVGSPSLSWSTPCWLSPSIVPSTRQASRGSRSWTCCPGPTWPRQSACFPGGEPTKSSIGPKLQCWCASNEGTSYGHQEEAGQAWACCEAQDWERGQEAGHLDDWYVWLSGDLVCPLPSNRLGVRLCNSAHWNHRYLWQSSEQGDLTLAVYLSSSCRDWSQIGQSPNWRNQHFYSSSIRGIKYSVIQIHYVKYFITRIAFDKG